MYQIVNESIYFNSRNHTPSRAETHSVHLIPTSANFEKRHFMEKRAERTQLDASFSPSLKAVQMQSKVCAFFSHYVASAVMLFTQSKIGALQPLYLLHGLLASLKSQLHFVGQSSSWLIFISFHIFFIILVHFIVLFLHFK